MVIKKPANLKQNVLGQNRKKCCDVRLVINYQALWPYSLCFYLMIRCIYFNPLIKFVQKRFRVELGFRAENWILIVGGVMLVHFKISAEQTTHHKA